jgi:hypothetical protein
MEQQSNHTPLNRSSITKQNNGYESNTIAVFTTTDKGVIWKHLSGITFCSTESADELSKKLNSAYTSCLIPFPESIHASSSINPKIGFGYNHILTIFGKNELLAGCEISCSISETFSLIKLDSRRINYLGRWRMSPSIEFEVLIGSGFGIFIPHLLTGLRLELSKVIRLSLEIGIGLLIPIDCSKFFFIKLVVEPKKSIDLRQPHSIKSTAISTGFAWRI